MCNSHSIPEHPQSILHLSVLPVYGLILHSFSVPGEHRLSLFGVKNMVIIEQFVKPANFAPNIVPDCSLVRRVI